MDLYDVVEEYITQEKMRFEGENGVENLKKLISTIGYRKNSFASSLENFLADNLGAQETIVNWISDQNINEWKENLQNELPEEEE